MIETAEEILEALYAEQDRSDALARLLSSHVSCSGYSFPQEVLDIANVELRDHGFEAYLEKGLVKYRAREGFIVDA